MSSSASFTLALAGNPNVGKSSLYNRLTGQMVNTANYAGKTVELSTAVTHLADGVALVVDTPGTYSLQGFSEDQRVARKGLTQPRPDVVVVVLDASNLRRNLQLYGEVADLGLPVLVALNLNDEARRLGRMIDPARLSEALGVPVVRTNGQTGLGLDELKRLALAARNDLPAPPLRLAPIAEEAIAAVSSALGDAVPDGVGGLGLRATARLLLEEDVETWRQLPTDLVVRLRSVCSGWQQKLRQANVWPLATERVRSASVIARSVTQAAAPDSRDWLMALWRASMDPRLGPMILLSVLALLGWFLFTVGGALSTAMSGLWQHYAMPLITSAARALFGATPAARIFTWTFGTGIEAALTIGVPFVFTFELILSLLEDTGYLNAAAYLADSFMQRIGLNGRAIIPMIAGAGCNVPAILGTRVLGDKRERFIASTLITLVPCSARTAIILGSVGVVSGWPSVLALVGVLFLVIFAVGRVLNRLMPGKPTDLVMEIFPLRRPLILATLKRTWVKFVGFLKEALPLMILGSLALGVLYETGWMRYLVAPLSPIVHGVLGLPAILGIALVFAVLRKELALQLTISLAAMVTGTSSLSALLTPDQVFVFALVSCLYIPCLATYGVLVHELGRRQAVASMSLTLALAVVVGFLARVVLAVI